MDFSERVLVLRVGKFKESDLWVRFLSPTQGLLTAFAFGGSRSRRRFVGCLDMFNEVHAHISRQSRGAYLTLREAVLIKGLTRLRHDWPRLGLATNCARFLQTVGVDAQGAEQSLFVMRQTLELLEKEDNLPGLLPLFFRARVAFDNGYALETVRCARCGRIFAGGKASLLLREGQLLCVACAGQQSGQSLELGAQSLQALHALQSLPPTQWGTLRLSSSEQRECGRAIDGFIQYHVGIVWENGRFIRH